MNNITQKPALVFPDDHDWFGGSIGNDISDQPECFQKVTTEF